MAKAFEKYLVTSAGTYRTDRELQAIIANLNREIARIDGASQEGLIRAAAEIHRETEKGSIKVPVDLGNLRHSWFVVTASSRIVAGGGRTRTADGAAASFVGKDAAKLAAGHTATITEAMGKAKSLSATGGGPIVIMGYSANYALWVHEMIGAKFKRRGAGPKWLEAAFKSKRDEILSIVRNTAKIK